LAALSLRYSPTYEAFSSICSLRRAKISNSLATSVDKAAYSADHF